MKISNIIDRARLTFRKDKDLRKSLYGIFGFYPHNIEFYHIALAHKSHAYRTQKGRSYNNERLEFLGDAILEAVVSDIVYHRYERRSEGFLTNTRSKIVQRASLNKLAKELGIEALIQAPTHSRGHNSYLGGNAFEALMGAAYLDRGYAHCKWFITHRIIGKMLDIDGVANKEVNFKSKLLEWSQKNKIQVEFQLLESTLDKMGSPMFKTSILIEGLPAGDGSGYSKKESQQIAAREALKKTRSDAMFLESIFDAKTKRTAMQADVYCSVPKIDEIELMLEKEAQQAKDEREELAAIEKEASVVEKKPTVEGETSVDKGKVASNSPKNNLPAAKEPAAAAKEPTAAAKESSTSGNESSTQETEGKSPSKKIHRGKARRNPAMEKTTENTAATIDTAKETKEKAKKAKSATKKMRDPLPDIGDDAYESTLNTKEEKPSAKEEKPSLTEEVTKSKKKRASKKGSTPKGDDTNPNPQQITETELSTKQNENAEEPKKKRPTQRKPRNKRPQMTEEERAALEAAREEQISAAEDAAYAELQ